MLRGNQYLSVALCVLLIGFVPFTAEARDSHESKSRRGHGDHDSRRDDDTTRHGNRESQFKRLVIFGDSLSDSGNYFIAFKEFTVRPFEPIASAPYLIGLLHFSNGKTWVERLARELGSPRSGRPSFAVPGFFTNYAVGRARARSEFSQFSRLELQVTDFLADFEGKAPPNRLYVVWIGANDVRDALEALASDPSGGETEKIVTGALAATFENLFRLLSAGAKSFLVLNIPNLAILPAVAGQEPPIPAIAEDLTDEYNFGLEELLRGLERQFPKSQFIRMNIFNLLDEVVDDPEDFDLSNVTDSCITPGVIVGAICKQPNQYLFWDFIHPTKKAHKIIAEQAEEILEDQAEEILEDDD